jgi:hypothetical protein
MAPEEPFRRHEPLFAAPARVGTTQGENDLGSRKATWFLRKSAINSGG